MLKIVFYLVLVSLGFIAGEFLASARSDVSPIIIARYVDDGCVAYCNGSPVMSYNNSCDGAQHAVCSFDGMTYTSDCLGDYNLIITQDLKVTVTCNGLFFNTIEGKDFIGKSSCGGSIQYDYYVASVESFKASTPVNFTCDGTFGEGVEVTSTPTLTPTPTPTLTPTPTPTLTLTPTPASLSPVEGGMIKDAPPGYTCTYMCGSEEYDGIVCKGDFSVNCDVEEKGQSSTLTYDCQGVFVGDWSASGCIGYGKIVDVGEDYKYTEICSKQMASKKLSNGGEEKACEGMYSQKTAVFAPALSQKIFAA